MSAAPGGVAVVLGAGNQGFLTVVDMLDCLFVHRECVLVIFLRLCFIALLPPCPQALVLSMRCASHGPRKSPIRTFGVPGGTKKTHEAEALGEKDIFFKEKENLDFVSL